jgi:hypothetical protein
MTDRKEWLTDLGKPQTTGVKKHLYKLTEVNSQGVYDSRHPKASQVEKKFIVTLSLQSCKMPRQLFFAFNKKRKV